MPPRQDALLLDLVGDVIGLLDLDELRTGLLGALRRAVPSDWASLNDVGPDHVVSIVEPELEPDILPRFAEHVHENPLLQHWERTQDGRAFRFSDVSTRAEREATRLHQEVYAPLGLNHQIAFTLPHAPDQVLALVLSRRDRDYSDDERDFLNRARPFLIQAYRNALAYSERAPRSPAGLERPLETHGLTPREAEVLALVAVGGSNRSVADRLGVSDRTVQKHLERTFRKLGVTTRSAAAARAWEMQD
ncbi:MAG: hypothetical protein QOE06_1347 [Thermoleophilaceae bacterium]|jgi:DNA-binding CsgD family transcriptional regulator|nr:hypothetical protein [Thermoleophilaceae bacterium]